MHKLVKKYETPSGTLPSIGAFLSPGAINSSGLNYQVLMNMMSQSNPTNSGVASTTAQPSVTQTMINNGDISSIAGSLPLFKTGDIDQDIISNAKTAAGNPNPVDVQSGNSGNSRNVSKNSTYENAMKGYGIQMMAGQLGQEIGGDWGDALSQIGGNYASIVANGGNYKDFLKAGNLGNLSANIGTGILNRHTTHDRYSGKHGDLAGGVDQIAGVFGANPYASLGMAAINKVTGGTDGMTTQDALLGSSAVAGALFAANPALGAAYMGVSALNSATGKTTQKFQGNDLASQEARAALGGSYGQTEGDLRAAQNRGGKKYGGISRLTGQYQRANRIVGEGNNYMASLNNIYDRRQLGQIRGQNMADINSLDYRLNTFGGYDQYGTVIGRKGMKLPTKMDRIQNILAMRKGGQMNVIPEGALHARLHHMETENKITKKGIPVVDKQGEQQAEIERNEIIFSLEVTNRLEELRKDGSEKAALEAGKLLVDEIFNNTDDRTGLIAEVTEESEAKKPALKEGGIIAEKPEFSIEAEEPSNEEDEVEYLEEGGIIAEVPDGSDDEEEVESYQKGGKKKNKFNIPDFLKYNENEDYYEPNLQFTYDKSWFDTEDGQKFLSYYEQEKTNNGANIRFIKRKKPLGGFGGEYEPANEFQPTTIFNGIPVKPLEGHFAEDGQQIYTDQRGETYTLQPIGGIEFKDGGIIDKINKLSPDKLQQLESILKLLNND